MGRLLLHNPMHMEKQGSQHPVLCDFDGVK